MENLNEIIVDKENIPDIFPGVNKFTTNGQIFKTVRRLEDEAKDKKHIIGNLARVYKWLIEYRDFLKVA